RGPLRVLLRDQLQRRRHRFRAACDPQLGHGAGRDAAVNVRLGARDHRRRQDQRPHHLRAGRGVRRRRRGRQLLGHAHRGRVVQFPRILARALRLTRQPHRRDAGHAPA
ncbi:MAG: hypothetical protein ACK55I_09275, partial [bacterium]